MATTRIIPLHTGKGRTVGKAISDIIGYVKNPEKTDHGRLITSYQCDSRVADAQFLLDKQTYAARTGRVRGADDVIAYHLRQSFVPGEITPEEANRLGVELARRFTKDKHAFIVCTHIDKPVFAFLLLPQFFLFLRSQGNRLQGGRDIPAHKVEVDFNLLRGVLAAFPGALMDKNFLYKLVEHGVCQRVEILILVNQGYKLLRRFPALLIAGSVSDY